MEVQHPKEPPTEHLGCPDQGLVLEQASIKLVNADNGRVITQLTEADFRELHWLADDLGGPEHQALADTLALFVAFLDGTNRVRGRRS